MPGWLQCHLSVGMLCALTSDTEGEPNTPSFMNNTISSILTAFLFSILGAFEKFRKAAIGCGHFLMSLLPSVRTEQLRSHRKDSLYKFGICPFSKMCGKNSRFFFKFRGMTCTFRKDCCTVVIKSGWILLIVGNVSDNTFYMSNKLLPKRILSFMR